MKDSKEAQALKEPERFSTPVTIEQHLQLMVVHK